MEVNWISLISSAIFGGLVGWGISFFIFRLKKYLDKKNLLKNIEKQKDIDFLIPTVENGEEIQEIVDVKVLAGIREPTYDDYEDEEENEDDLLDEEIDEKKG